MADLRDLATTGDDTISGADEDDLLRGLEGRDILEGGLGADEIDGDAGNDTLYGNSATTDGASIVDQPDGRDTIRGGDGDDEIRGNQNDDRLFGDDGADLIIGGRQSDLLDGGAGDDTLFGDGSPPPAGLSLTPGPAASRLARASTEVVAEVPPVFGFVDRLVEVFYTDEGLGPEPYGIDEAGNDVSGEAALSLALGDSPSATSLPRGSFAVFQFVDEVIVDGEGDDIFLDEVGSAGEIGVVFVSNDGVNFSVLGLTFDGQETGLDLQRIGFDEPVRFVRVEAANNAGTTPGYDVVSIRGNAVPVPEGDDTLTGGPGDDLIDGGGGTDTAVYSGSREDYTVSGTTVSATVSGPDGTDTLAQVERLSFLGDGTALDLPVGDPAGQPPEAVGDTAATAAGTPVTIDVLDNDSDPEGTALTLVSVSAPGGGTARLDAGQVVYTPADGFAGVDSFSYTVRDATGAVGTGFVAVTVGTPAEPSRSDGFIRGTDRDDVIAIAQNATYLGRGGDDTYLVSGVASPDAVSVIEDSAGQTTIQLVPGLEVVASIALSNAVALTLANGAEIQILSADSFVFDVGGNDTVGTAGVEQDFATFVAKTLGISDGETMGGPFIVDPALDPGIGDRTSVPEEIDFF